MSLGLPSTAAPDDLGRPRRFSMAALPIESRLVLVALAALIVLGWTTEAPIFEPIRNSRLTWELLLCTPALLVFGLLLRGAAGLRRFLFDWLPVYGTVAVYESLKHMHANRITTWLGIQPKDGLMLRIDEILFGKALPLWLDGHLGSWAIETLRFAYIWIYYLGPTLALAWAYFRLADRKLFLELRRGLTFVLLGGYVFYILVPVAGPLFLIGDQFRQPISTQPVITRWVFDVLRYNWDCFPSLHTAVPWLLTGLLWRSIGTVVRVFAVTCSILVTISTIALRLHYGIDVIAGIAWAAIVCVVVQRWAPVAAPAAAGARARRRGAVARDFAIVGILFTTTGFTGVVQEQAFEKLVGSLLGNSTPAAAMVLATYSAGILGGAWAYALLRPRVRRPVRVYGWLQATAAVWAVGLFFLFDRLTSMFLPLLRAGFASDWGLPWARLAVTAIWILPTALCMGATLPAIADTLLSLRLRDSGRALAYLYSLNLLGAMAGATLGPYLLFSRLGADRPLALAALLGLLVGATALVLDRRRQTVARSAPARLPHPTGRLASGCRLLLVISLAAGFSLMALEVIWLHLLSAVLGSAYAFATMLAAVLIGLFLGSQAVVLAFPRRRHFPPVAPGFLLLASALPLAAAHAVWPHVPELLAELGASSTTFAAGETLKLALALVLVVPASALVGAVFPALFRVESTTATTREQRTWLVGLLVAANASGCILGALAANFAVLPLLGSEMGNLAMGAACAIFGLGLLLAARPSPRVRQRFLLFGLGCMAALAIVPRWDRLALTSGDQIYFYGQHVRPGTRLLFFHEDPQGGITTVIETPAPPGGQRRGLRTLLANGHSLGNDAWEAEWEVASALIPILHSRRPADALVIGYGTGRSVQVVRAMGFARTAVAEAAAGVLVGGMLFRHLNEDVLTDPRTTLHREDGRNLLLLDERKYDLVITEVASVWLPGATDLYSRDFYALASSRLAPGGMFQQWLQLHHLGTDEVGSALATARSVFPEVSLWVLGDRAIIVASEGEQRLEGKALARLIAAADRLGWPREQVPDRLAQLLASRLLAPEDVTRLCTEMRTFDPGERRFGVNTDRNRRFERSMRGLYLSRVDHRARTMASFARFASFPPLQDSGSDVPPVARHVLADWTPARSRSALELTPTVPNPRLPARQP